MTPPEETGIARAINEAHETASRCRAEAAIIKQTGMFQEYQNWLTDNAKEAERWAIRQAKKPA